MAGVPLKSVLSKNFVVAIERFPMPVEKEEQA